MSPDPFDLPTIYKKTVYDPKVYSDADMFRWATEAAYDAKWRGNMPPAGSWTGTASNGMKFEGWIRDGQITSFYPIF